MKNHIMKYKHHCFAAFGIAMVFALGMVLQTSRSSHAQSAPSIILSPSTGGDCGLVGTWTPLDTGGGICTLATDYDGAVEIQGANITLNCQDASSGENHSLTGDGTGNGVTIDTQSTATVQNCDINNFAVGVYGYMASDATIDDNTIHDNGVGIMLETSLDTEITNNTLTENQTGIEANNSTGGFVNENTVSNNGSIGINMIDSSIAATGNTLVNNASIGISYQYPTAVRITPVVIRQNAVSGSEMGISIANSPEQSIMLNELYGNCVGLAATQTDSLIISGNKIISGRGVGMQLESAKNSTISQNNIEDSSVGMWLGMSDGNTITANSISGNDTGIQIESSIDNTIYNNFFQNALNTSVDVSSTGNTWSFEWDGGDNILFRSMPGTVIGNYWSGYTGIDDDENGIGDSVYYIDDINSDDFPLVLEQWTTWDISSGAAEIDISSIAAGQVNLDITSSGEGVVEVGDYIVTLPDGNSSLMVEAASDAFAISVLGILESSVVDEPRLESLEQFRHDLSGLLGVISLAICNDGDTTCAAAVVNTIDSYLSLPVPNDGDTATRLESLEQFRHDLSGLLGVISLAICNDGDTTCAAAVVNTIDSYLSLPVPNDGDTATRLESLEQFRHDLSGLLGILSLAICNDGDTTCAAAVGNTIDPYLSLPVPNTPSVEVEVEDNNLIALLNEVEDSIAFDAGQIGVLKMENDANHGRLTSLEQFRNDTSSTLGALSNAICNDGDMLCVTTMMNVLTPYMYLPVPNDGDTATRLESLEQFRHDLSGLLGVISLAICNDGDTTCAAAVVNTIDSYLSLPVPNDGDTATRLESLEQFRHDLSGLLGVISLAICNDGDTTCVNGLLNVTDTYLSLPVGGESSDISIMMFDGSEELSIEAILAHADDGLLYSSNTGEDSFSIEGLTDIADITLYQQDGFATSTVQDFGPGDKISSSVDDENGLNMVTVESGELTLKMKNHLSVPTAIVEADAGDSVRVGTNDLLTNTIAVDAGSINWVGQNSDETGVLEADLSAGDQIANTRTGATGGLTVQNLGDTEVTLNINDQGSSVAGLQINMMPADGTVNPKVDFVDNDDNTLLPPSEDFKVIPLSAGVTLSCDSAAETTDDQCFAVRSELMVNDVAQLEPANVQLLDAAGTQTMLTQGVTVTQTFDTVVIDGQTLSEQVNVVALAPMGAAIDGNGVELIECGSQLLSKEGVNILQRVLVGDSQECPVLETDTDGDGVNDDEDECPMIYGTVSEGCPARLKNELELYRQGSGWLSIEKEPMVGQEVEVYSDSSCAEVDDITWLTLYSKTARQAYIDTIRDNCTPDHTGVTDAEGIYRTGLDEGQAFVYSSYQPDDVDYSVDLARVEIVQAKDSNKIKLGALRWQSLWGNIIRYTPLDFFFISGSELELAVPEYIEWEEGQTLESYPIISSSADEWSVDFDVTAPNGAEMDESTDTTYVDDSTEITVFELSNDESVTEGVKIDLGITEITPGGSDMCGINDKKAQIEALKTQIKEVNDQIKELQTEKKSAATRADKKAVKAQIKDLQAQKKDLKEQKKKLREEFQVCRKINKLVVKTEELEVTIGGKDLTAKELRKVQKKLNRKEEKIQILIEKLEVLEK